MKIRRTDDLFHIDLTPAEARVLFDELSSVRGGARLPKIRQVCQELDRLFTLVSIMAPPKLGRRPKQKVATEEA